MECKLNVLLLIFIAEYLGLSVIVVWGTPLIFTNECLMDLLFSLLRLLIFSYSSSKLVRLSMSPLFEFLSLLQSSSYDYCFLLSFLRFLCSDKFLSPLPPCESLLIPVLRGVSGSGELLRLEEVILDLILSGITI